MLFPKKQHFKHKRRPPRETFDKPTAVQELVHPEHTGSSETAYFKSLVDSHAKVTVVLNDGEQFRGRIRYYDRHCFSIGLSAEGPRIFLRKAAVAYILEEE